MLDETLKQQMSSYLQLLQRSVELIAYTDDSAKSLEMMQLLEQIVSVSDKVNLIVSQQQQEIRRPSFAIRSVGGNESITFAGIPLGHEFTSLVLALLQVGGHSIKLDEQVINQVQQLSGTYNFETYFSLTCQNCPDVVQALNTMAVLNPNIKHTAIDGGVFPQEVEQRQIMSVPSIYLNGEEFAQGRMSVEEILAKLDSSIGDKKAKQLSSKPAYDVLVVGGGPAGAAAAIYAARKGLTTAVAAQRFGGQVLDTLSIENLIGTPKTDGPHLAQALEQHVREYDVDIINLQQATKLTRTDNLIKVDFASGASLKGKAVIVATGAKWRNLNIPGEAEYLTKGVTFCPHCDGPLFKGKSVAVIGGGNSGVEAALDLAGIVKDVTLLEFSDKLRADSVLQEKLFSTSNIKVIFNAKAQQISGDGSKVTGLIYQDMLNNTEQQIDLAGIFIQIGLVPSTQWLQDSNIELNQYGEIIVDQKGKTSVDGVFAAGDATNVPYKQIIIAMGDGSKASIAAFDYLIRNSN